MDPMLKILCQKALTDQDNPEHLRAILSIIQKNTTQANYFYNYPSISILLLQKLISTYYVLDTPIFTPEESSKICTVLNIYQVLLEIQEIKDHFMNAQLAFYLYPFLNVTQQTKQYESLRIASLGVLGTLLKNDEKQTIEFLKNTELVPLTLKIMDIGSEVSKVIATHIFVQIINNDEGLEYVCQTFDRFVAITMILNSMVYQCIASPSKKIIEFALDCYIRLCQMENVRSNFCNKKPDALMNKEIQRQIAANKECAIKFEKFMNIIHKN